MQIEGFGRVRCTLSWLCGDSPGNTRDKAFDNDVLLLIVPDSAHTMHTPITLGTLHTDMAIKLATKKELENLNKQWKWSLIATKLTMEESTVSESRGCTNSV